MVLLCYMFVSKVYTMLNDGLSNELCFIFTPTLCIWSMAVVCVYSVNSDTLWAGPQSWDGFDRCLIR